MTSRLFMTGLLGFLAFHVSAGARPDLLARLQVPVKTLTVFGQRMAYYEAGPAGAPTVILIPSLGWDSNAWAQNAPGLARHYHVIAIDPLGLGKSAKPLVDYKMDTWTDCFAELMRVKKIPHATFVGAVMGGALTVQMALDHPELVDAIVVAASNSGPGAHLGGANSPTFGPSLAGTRASLLEAFSDPALVTDALIRARLAYRLASGDGYTIQRHLADHRPPYSPAELAKIKVPALFIWGREDKTTPVPWGEDFSAALPGSRLVLIDHCGHYPNIEQPSAFNEALSAFLSSVHGPVQASSHH